MYIEEIEDFKKEHPAYINDIGNLVEYYRVVEKTDFYNENVLGGVRTKHILNSIIWLTEEKMAFHSKATANKYKNAIVTLFRQLIDQGLENADFQSQYRMEPNKHNSYWYQCNKYINNCDMLITSRSYDALEEDAVESLLSDCDIAVGDYIDIGDKSERVAFNNMVSALMVKVILLTGMKYQKVRLIPSSAFDKTNRTLKISEISINVPFAKQLNTYLEASAKYEKNVLFLQFGGHQFPEKSGGSVLSNFLSYPMQSYSVDKLVKVGIQQLLMLKMNETVIRRLTGAKDKIMDSCFDALYKDHDWSPEINEVLLKTEYFKYF